MPGIFLTEKGDGIGLEKEEYIMYLERRITIHAPQSDEQLGVRPFTQKTSAQKADPQRRQPNREMSTVVEMIRDY